MIPADEHADHHEHAAEHDLRHEAGPALDPAEQGRELRPVRRAPPAGATTEWKIAW
jgi:hypothetical protein